MHWNKVVLDSSFEEYIGGLPLQTQEEISFVLEGLGHDVYFMPGEDYVAARDGDNFVICEHVRGWQGWYLGWYYEYWNSTATIENIVAYLDKRPGTEESQQIIDPSN